MEQVFASDLTSVNVHIMVCRVEQRVEGDDEAQNSVTSDQNTRHITGRYAQC